MEVVDEELCINEVARIPINKPTKGLDVVEMSASARPLPNNLSAPPIKFMLNRKR
jgi:hypothetical protein